MRKADIPRRQRPGTTRVLALGFALAALALSGCGLSTEGNSERSSASAPAPTLTSLTSSSSTVQSRTAPASAARPRGVRRSANGLAYSTASGQIVQSQPAPGSCHAIGSGLYSRPDPRCTPGALNPAVTQANIGRTICRDGWTDTARPPEGVTEPEKAASMAAYSDSGPVEDYEYDHFVPLELGGAVNDPRNLWPEPGASPNPKDAVEDELNREVCDGRLALAQAQRAIATDWLTAPNTSPGPELGDAPSGAATAAPKSTPSVPSAATCGVTASYDERYDDYDVYVHSNEPDQTVTVSDAYGHSDSWHTDGSGYADVYFKSGGYAPGRQITARVGQATCSTTL
ncbi:MAG TPA: hypothetical protein VMA77_15305 [Solirubrobacteraceae bacterium]|nr:hypothetical protein [Solirubrobacteraceae bacterium]